MKKFFLSSLVLLFSSIFIAFPAQAEDICCLSGFVPLGDGCVNTMVEPACDGVALGLCSSNGLTMALCSIPDVVPAMSLFCQDFVQTASVFTSEGFCSGLLGMLGSSDLGIYDNCVSIIDFRFGLLSDLVGNIATNNLCTFGSHNQFYFCYPDGDINQRGIPTGIGCVPTDIIDFLSRFIQWSIGVGVVVNLLVIVYSSFLFITGGHDPKKVQAGKEAITASLAGLIFILLCVVFINYIGDSLLNLGPIGFRQ